MMPDLAPLGVRCSTTIHQIISVIHTTKPAYFWMILTDTDQLLK